MEEPSKEEFHEWKESPVTHYVFEMVREMKSEFENQVVEGKYKDDPSGYMYAVGAIHGFNYLLRAEYEEESDE